MLKKIAMISGVGFLIAGLSACDTSASSSTIDNSVPQPIAESTVIDKTSHTTSNKTPIYGAPTVAPGLPNPYTTTTESTDYILVVSYDENNINVANLEVSESTFNMCVIGQRAVQYDNGITICMAPVEEGSEAGETGETQTDEENTEMIEEEIPEETVPEEPIPTVPNGFADKE